MLIRQECLPVSGVLFIGRFFAKEKRAETLF